MRETRQVSFAALARQEFASSTPALQATLREIVGRP
jgi:hypothetical protein